MLDPMLVAMLEQQFGERATWAEPDDVRTIADRETLSLAGLSVTVDHAPGHTEGSVMFRLPDTASADGAGLTSGSMSGGAG